MKIDTFAPASWKLKNNTVHERKESTDGVSLMINKVSRSVVEMERKQSVLNHNGIRISQTGYAKHLVVMTHSGWKEIEKKVTLLCRQVGDGWTSVPHGTRVDFYTEDHNFTKGLSVLSAVNKRVDSLKELEVSLDLTINDLELLARSRNMSFLNLKDEMIKQSISRKECANSGDVVKNYALYHHEQTDYLIKKHQHNYENKEVDIAFVIDKKHKRHLSDVFEAIKKSGVEYKVIHFAGCRVNRGS
jgi:hypothetical protein